MSAFTTFVVVISILILVWAIWFIIRLVQYIRSGEYELDQRLRDICR